jgi:hypothetical protein
MTYPQITEVLTKRAWPNNNFVGGKLIFEEKSK